MYMISDNSSVIRAALASIMEQHIHQITSSALSLKVLLSAPPLAGSFVSDACFGCVSIEHANVLIL